MREIFEVYNSFDIKRFHNGDQLMRQLRVQKPLTKFFHTELLNFMLILKANLITRVKPYAIFAFRKLLSAVVDE